MGNAGWVRGRILNTVWFVSTDESTREVFDHVKAILAAPDRLIVVNAAEAFWHNLLVPDPSLQIAFESGE